MKVRNAHDKFLVILFLCFTLISQLGAAPRNGLMNVLSLDLGRGNSCTGTTTQTILDIEAKTFLAVGNCKRNGVGPNITFNISTTFVINFPEMFPGVDGISGTLSQSLNRGVLSNYAFTGSIKKLPLGKVEFSMINLVLNPLTVIGTFEALAAEPIPILSTWE